MDNKTYRKFMRVCGIVLILSGFLLLYSYVRTFTQFYNLLLGVVSAGFGWFLFNKYK
jgi:hypothetical protein